MAALPTALAHLYQVAEWTVESSSAKAEALPPRGMLSAIVKVGSLGQSLVRVTVAALQLFQSILVSANSESCTGRLTSAANHSSSSAAELVWISRILLFLHTVLRPYPCEVLD